MQTIDISPCTLDERCEALRAEVRAFIAEHIGKYSPAIRARNWAGGDPEWSRMMGERGWIGMTWPKRYGGHERSSLERYVVLEEMLSAGAPVGAHWIADRQSAPLLMRYSPDVLAPRIVPEIVKGSTYFCIGMSEPDSGSDLASIRTRASKIDGGWVINGSKLWTSGAHYAKYMIALVRTEAKSDNRHAGMSQFLIDMNTPGVTHRPIRNMIGDHDFNEVFLENVEVPDENLIGNPGDGWHQVTAELSFERSGPERYLSCSQLLFEMLDAAETSDPRHRVELGRLTARYATMRQMSLGVAGMLHRGENPSLPASVVKDLGALLEQGMPDIAHDLFGGRITPDSSLDQVLAYLAQANVSFSMRGGTREILRGIIARGLGLR